MDLPDTAFDPNRGLPLEKDPPPSVGLFRPSGLCRNHEHNDGIDALAAIMLLDPRRSPAFPGHSLEHDRANHLIVRTSYNTRHNMPISGSGALKDDIDKAERLVSIFVRCLLWKTLTSRHC